MLNSISVENDSCAFIFYPLCRTNYKMVYITILYINDILSSASKLLLSSIVNINFVNEHT